MDQSKITVRYAKAFFSLAKEKNKLDALKKDIELVFTLCQESVDFRLLLESPVVKTSRKIKFIQSVFSKKTNELSLSFLELITTNKREAHLPGICRNFLSLYRQEQGVKSAMLTTAVEIDPAIIGKIKANLEKELKVQIEMSKQVDDKLIGGFVLRIEDQQLDASIASQLRKVKEKLLQTENK